jgi:hypothetical protein
MMAPKLRTNLDTTELGEPKGIHKLLINKGI